MRTGRILSVLTLAIAAAAGGSALGSSMNVRVTRDAMASSYLRYDGSSDATMAACSTGRRPQNEPTVAVTRTRRTSS